MTPATDHPCGQAVAIDGPAASGKSTIAKRLAERLGLMMVNSGTMYRAVTWKALREGIDPSDAAAVGAMLDRSRLACPVEGRDVSFTIDGVNPGGELRGETVNAHVSAIAAIPAVRARLISLQRACLEHGNLVMEGRDIGSVVFPDTPFKIYIDASEEERQRRRGCEGLADPVSARDAADASRATAPLVVAPGATVIDTTHLSIDAAVDAVIASLRALGFPMPDADGGE